MYKSDSLSCLLICLLYFASEAFGQQDNRVTLYTPHGLFIGLREQLNRTAFYAFKGIEYGEAERWKESTVKEINGGSEPMLATQSGSVCPQWMIAGQRPVGSEDCLFLNVFTPYIPASGGQGGGLGAGSSQPLLPVMVYFHGGGYMVGSADSAGPRRLMHQRVVLVTVNYRLGVFGYLSTADEEIPGNFGALDQITALKWVKQYIRHFGGNPDRVTIFGNSAGGASVHLLTLSPRAFGLFHGAIIQSGNALCDWAVEENPLSYAHELAESVGCSSTDDSSEMTECLRGKDIDELITAQQNLVKIWFMPIRAAPVVDNEWRGEEEAFLPDSPGKLMEAGAFVQVPIMTGVVSDEGLMAAIDIHIARGDNFKTPSYFRDELIPTILENFLDDGDSSSGVVADAVMTQYFAGVDFENDTQASISGLSDLIGDISFLSCQHEFLEKLAASDVPAYSYLFSYKTPKSPSVNSRAVQNLRQTGVQHTLFDNGVSHCDELFYLFEPFNFLPGNLNQRMGPEDLKVADGMAKIWTSFAATGNPSNGLMQTGRVNNPWRQVREGNINAYNLPLNMEQEFRQGDAIFWSKTVPYLRELGDKITDLEFYYTLFWVFLGLFIAVLLITLILGFVLWKKRTSQSANL